ncbi:dihydrolipoyl dehydrogenase [Facklamia hominis]|uniref:Dihydrolipoyl dehydrogenase n=2 Tax=Lactobacillales TaxID=186826 RepID=K1LFQ0_9LACT|nr:dihydrolipoyl dehydrogenase [Facklamia hominis]EKB53436.1 dihydrolipoyl dehydrogenase [Facklamia hominis CCUG 36813]EPH11598.1 dihydrolipoyl dehydrogenase [Facklamia hominis ACS-120-V-Sch10]RYC97591.1 dihydrolipoyl dehydrogenase [Facklamia hominis]WPJ90177.1 dihydrolipoyl dehydrogenase [Facklamia hominis]
MVVGDFAVELDTVVIGAGPGGYVAAIRAAQLGQKVAIVEKEYFGGVCLNVGCIPSKALIQAAHTYQLAKHPETFGITTKDVEVDWEKTQDWKQNSVVQKMTSGVEMLLKKNKVEIIRGEAFFSDKDTIRVVNGEEAQTYTFNNAILATGSRPIEIKGFPFGERIIDSTGGLNLPQIPKDLVIIGGGIIGSELGAVYASFGTKVTILEGSKQFIPSFEKDMARLVEKDFKKKGAEIITKAMAKGAEVKGDRVIVTYEHKGEEKTVEADYCMVTVGRRPNTDQANLDLAGIELDEHGKVKVDKQGRTSNPHIFAIGDIVPGAMLAHKASFEGKVAAAAISGRKDEVDYKAMPSVCYTDPELAEAGYTKDSAKEAGLDVKVTKFPFGGNGRAVAMDSYEGFVRIVSTKEDNVIVGAQIAGPGASDLLAELTMAIEAGMNAEDIALTVHPHPTLTEAIMDCAEAVLGEPIHM